jgi:hypothetical protein
MPSMVTLQQSLLPRLRAGAPLTGFAPLLRVLVCQGEHCACRAWLQPRDSLCDPDLESGHRLPALPLYCGCRFAKVSTAHAEHGRGLLLRGGFDSTAYVSPSCLLKCREVRWITPWERTRLGWTPDSTPPFMTALSGFPNPILHRWTMDC